MKVQINGHPVDFELDEEITVAAVVDSITKWAGQRDLVLSGYSVDGKEYMPDDSPVEIIENVDTLNCQLRSRADVVISALQEAGRYCDRISQFAGRIAEGAGSGLETARDLASGIDWVSDVMRSTLNLLGIDPEMFRVKDVPVSRYLDELRGLRDSLAGVSSEDDFRTKLSRDIGLFSEIRDFLRHILISGEMRSLILRSIDSPDVLMESMASISNSLEGELENIEQIAAALQAGKDAEAVEKLNGFIEFIFNFTRSSSQFVPVFGIQLSDIEIDGVTLEDKNRTIQDMLNSVIEAMENSDMISLADILEYEIREALSDLSAYIDILLSKVDIKQ